MNSVPGSSPALLAATLPPCALTSSCDDGQADAEPRLVDRHVGVEREQVEDVRQRVGRDADALVGDADRDLVGAASIASRMSPPRRRSPRGVVQQVAEHLRQPLRVAVHAGRPRRELGAQALSLGVDRMAAGIDRLGDDEAEVERAALEAELAGADARAVEQVVDQARHVRRLALDDLVLGGANGVVGLGVLERRRRHADRRQRVAQRVRRHRDEVDLPVMRFLGVGLELLRALRGADELLVRLEQLAQPRLVLRERRFGALGGATGGSAGARSRPSARLLDDLAAERVADRARPSWRGTSRRRRTR